MNADRTDIQLAQLFSRQTVDLDGQKMRIIDLQSVRLISDERRTAAREVEISCLKNKIVPVRYLRNIGTIGIRGQLKLLRSRVAVCGVGGLGGTIAELLARQGVGKIIAIDKGILEESNLNRQRSERRLIPGMFCSA